MVGVCSGNSKDHCCYVDGKPCQFLEKDTVPGRKWACGLRRRFGNWGDVHQSDEYKTPRQTKMGRNRIE
jgi:hypothetical protein